MSHITSSELARMAGIDPRHAKRLLAKGAVPGALRKPSGHWQIPDSEPVREWARDFKRWPTRRQVSSGEAAAEASERKLVKSVNRQRRILTPPPPPAPATRSGKGSHLVTLHRRAEDLQKKARLAIEKLAKARREVAAVAEAESANHRRGVDFARWWVAQGLPPEWAAKYLKLAGLDDGNDLSSKDRMRLIGAMLVAEKRPDSGAQNKADLFSWTKSATKINHTLTPEFIGRMGSIERDAAAKQLEPLVKLYERMVRKSD